MMTLHTSAKFIIGHVLAGAVVILGTLIMAFACYVYALATAPNGIDSPVAVIPEFFTLMFMTGVVAVVVSIALFLISILLMWIRYKRNFPAWIPIGVIPAIIFIGLLVFRGKSDIASIAGISGIVFIYFGIYWTLLTYSGFVLDFFHRVRSRRKAV